MQRTSWALGRTLKIWKSRLSLSRCSDLTPCMSCVLVTTGTVVAVRHDGHFHDWSDVGGRIAQHQIYVFASSCAAVTSTPISSLSIALEKGNMPDCPPSHRAEVRKSVECLPKVQSKSYPRHPFPSIYSYQAPEAR